MQWTNTLGWRTGTTYREGWIHEELSILPSIAPARLLWDLPVARESYLVQVETETDFAGHSIKK
jgi:hypothetical protein